MIPTRPIDKPEHRVTPSPAEIETEVARASSDGRPAHPEYGPRGLVVLLAGGLVVIVLAAVAAAVLVDPMLGLVLGLGGIALFLVSPAAIATIARSRDRRVAIDRIADERRPDAAAPSWSDG